MKCEMNMSRRLPPEDISVGQYVSVLHVVHEDLPFCLDTDSAWREVRPIRTLLMPSAGGMPFKVVEVCLPFVLVERPGGKHRTLDVRRVHLARVSDRYGQEVFRCIQQDQDKDKAEEDGKSKDDEKADAKSGD